MWAVGPSGNTYLPGNIRLCRRSRTTTGLVVCYHPRESPKRTSLHMQFISQSCPTQRKSMWIYNRQQLWGWKSLLSYTLHDALQPPHSTVLPTWNAVSAMSAVLLRHYQHSSLDTAFLGSTRQSRPSTISPPILKINTTLDALASRTVPVRR